MFKRTKYLLLSFVLISQKPQPTYCQNIPVQQDTLLPKEQYILRTFANLVQRYHYSPKRYDDTLSKKIFYGYLKKLDPNKIIFLQEDILALDSFKYQLDDELIGNSPSLSFYQHVQARYIQRVANLHQLPIFEKNDWQPRFIGQKLLPGDSLSWSTDLQAQYERWDKLLSYQYYSKLSDKKLSDQEKNDLTTFLRKKYTHFIHNIQTNKDAYLTFSAYVNAIAEQLDPHSEYQPPVNKSQFDEMMSNAYYGIGISLINTNLGDIAIEKIMLGMPAANSNSIHEGDIILAIADNVNGTWEDIAGWDTKELSTCIRGKENSFLRLRIKQKETNKIIEITLKREKVNIKESYARSTILISPKNKKVGFIFLPEFYNDYSHFDGAKCADDIANEIKQLKQNNIDALIIDLRFNGGGSLSDVVKIAGYFIKYGPIVQIKNQLGEVSVLADEDGETLYDGPLSILVNEYSASASEILAAAMQDYHRALIIGSNTFGKGTVQRQLPLSYEKNNKTEELGAVKLTMQKFYRINGATTQKVGIHPDVHISNITSYHFAKEKDKLAVLASDTIPAANYHTTDYITEKQKLVTQKYILSNDTLKRMDKIAKGIHISPSPYIGDSFQKKYNNTTKEQFALFKKFNTLSPKHKIKTIKIGSNIHDAWYQNWVSELETNYTIASVLKNVIDKN